MSTTKLIRSKPSAKRSPSSGAGTVGRRRGRTGGMVLFVAQSFLLLFNMRLAKRRRKRRRVSWYMRRAKAAITAIRDVATMLIKTAITSLADMVRETPCRDIFKK